jgi:hypothetical protein
MMTSYYIYKATVPEKGTNAVYTICFVPSQQIDFDKLLNQLKSYFQENVIPDHLVIIVGEYLREDFTRFWEQEKGRIKEIIPTKYYQRHIDSTFLGIYAYDKMGKLSYVAGIKFTDPGIWPKLMKPGLVKIFKDRGGLIVSQRANHFVFPSGKHCDKFLRTGNVLIRSEEILFIAFNILSKFKDDFEIIYCDTSSINSLAFALVELKRRLSTDFVSPHIESFGSYKKFEQTEFIDRHKSLFLISSSTSANIIDRLISKHVELDHICLIYCLNAQKYREQIVCDLHKKEDHIDGYECFQTYAFNEECSLCREGSVPVMVHGDVFLLDRPNVNKIILGIKDAPDMLSGFMKKYLARGRTQSNFIKSNYFENSTKTQGSQFAYEVFFDIEHLFSSLENASGIFPEFKEKVDRHIHQYIPSNTRYIIHLPDEASRQFAIYIREKIKVSIKDEYLPEIKSQDEIDQLDPHTEGAAIIVCSSMVSGGNLIFVSKEMRDYNKLSLIYFIGFSRTSDEDYLKFLRNNLGQGAYGISTNTFISIESIHCTSEYKRTSWLVEQEFVKNFILFCDDGFINEPEKVREFFVTRDQYLSEGLKTKNRGMANGLFYPNLYSDKPLAINKNFAFFKFHNYDMDASQADIYFTMSTIINRLRYSKDLHHCLHQSEYVRNILDPENFTRFNDGIIQASILRAAHPLELAYDIDKEVSKKFLNIITPFVIHAKDDYGEALMEFLYAIAIRKLRLHQGQLSQLISLVKERCMDQVVLMAMCTFIEKLYLENNQDLVGRYFVSYEMI